MQEAPEPVAEASTSADSDKQSSAAARCRAPVDTEPSRLDRMTMARTRSPMANHRRDKNSEHHRYKCGCIGDSASCWPRFVCNLRGKSIRDAMRAQEFIVGRISTAFGHSVRKI